MFERFRRTALAAACLPALSAPVAEAQQIFGDARFAYTPVPSPYFPPTPLPQNKEKIVLSESDSIGKEYVIIAALLVLGVGGAAQGTIRSKRAVARCHERIPEFGQFVKEFDAFNNLHSGLSGLNRGNIWRHGRAARFPELSHSEAFEKAWKPFLNDLGLGIFYKSESTDVLHGRLELTVQKPRALFTFLCAHGDLDKKTSALSRRGLVLICEASEEFILASLRQNKTVYSGGFFDDIATLIRGMKKAGREGNAESLDFYYKVRYGNNGALLAYAKFKHHILNEIWHTDQYYITPQNLLSALNEVAKCVSAASQDAFLRPLADRALWELEEVIEGLESFSYRSRPVQPKEESSWGSEIDSDGSNVAVLEEEAAITPLMEHSPSSLVQARERLRTFKCQISTVTGSPLT